MDKVKWKMQVNPRDVATFIGTEARAYHPSLIQIKAHNNATEPPVVRKIALFQPRHVINVIIIVTTE